MSNVSKSDRADIVWAVEFVSAWHRCGSCVSEQEHKDRRAYALKCADEMAEEYVRACKEEKS